VHRFSVFTRSFFVKETSRQYGREEGREKERQKGREWSEGSGGEREGPTMSDSLHSDIKLAVQ